MKCFVAKFKPADTVGIGLALFGADSSPRQTPIGIAADRCIQIFDEVSGVFMISQKSAMVITGVAPIPFAT